VGLLCCRGDATDRATATATATATAEEGRPLVSYFCDLRPPRVASCRFVFVISSCFPVAIAAAVFFRGRGRNGGGPSGCLVRVAKKRLVFSGAVNCVAVAAELRQSKRRAERRVVVPISTVGGRAGGPVAGYCFRRGRRVGYYFLQVK